VYFKDACMEIRKLEPAKLDPKRSENYAATNTRRRCKNTSVFFTYCLLFYQLKKISQESTHETRNNQPHRSCTLQYRKSGLLNKPKHCFASSYERFLPNHLRWLQVHFFWQSLLPGTFLPSGRPSKLAEMVLYSPPESRRQQRIQ
jgi:hypothetical protein